MRAAVFNSENSAKIVIIFEKILNKFFNEVNVITLTNFTDICSENFDILIVNRAPLDVKSVACEIAVINSDDAEVLGFLKKADAGVVTYGFNSRASVTVSSMGERGIMVCVQRAFAAIGGDAAEPMEFPVSGFIPDHLAADVFLPVAAGCLAAGVPPKIIGESLSAETLFVNEI